MQITAATLAQAEGRPIAVVNVTSGLALAPKKTAPVYCATKSAIRTFTLAVGYQAADAESNVLLSEALLSLVDTPMTAGRGSTSKQMLPGAVADAIRCRPATRTATSTRCVADHRPTHHQLPRTSTPQTSRLKTCLISQPGRNRGAGQLAVVAPGCAGGVSVPSVSWRAGCRLRVLVLLWMISLWCGRSPLSCGPAFAPG